MKEKSDLRKIDSKLNSEKAGIPKKDSAQQRKNLKADGLLHKKLAKRSNYHNDGPGGGYEGL
ncbi:MAG: hypothetical protein NVS9B7_10100 [Flavisolibacter sp.]